MATAFFSPLRAAASYLGRDFWFVGAVALGVGVIAAIADVAEPGAVGSLVRMALGFAIVVAASAAFLRRAADPAAPPVVRVSREELRLSGAYALLAFLFTLALAVSIFLGAFFVSVLAAAAGFHAPAGKTAAPSAESLAALSKATSGPEAHALGVALFLAVTLAMVWIAARLALVGPATLAEQRIRVLSTFAATKGRALPIMATLAIIAAVGAGLSYALGAAANAVAPTAGALADGLWAAGLVAFVLAPWSAACVALHAAKQA